MYSKIDFKFSTSVKSIYVILFLVLIVGCVVFSLLHVFANWIFEIKDVMAYLTGSVAIITLIHHIRSYQEMNEMQDVKIQMLKNQYTNNAISIMLKPDMTECLRGFKDVKEHMEGLSQTMDTKKGDYIKKIEEYIDNNPKDHSRTMLLLNLFENICVQVDKGTVNEDIIKDNFKSMFINSFKTMRPYIKHIQKEEGCDRFWISFENRVKEWSK